MPDGIAGGLGERDRCNTENISVGSVKGLSILVLNPSHFRQ